MILKNANIVLSDKVEMGSLLIENGKIIKISNSPISNPNNVEEVDLDGDYLLPGFIDTHTHGIGGIDFMDGDSSKILEASHHLLKHGVTSFFPTILTEKKEKLRQALQSIKDVKYSNNLGASIIGVHVEGPFFSYEYKGAQNPSFITNGSIEIYLDYFNGYEDIISIVSLAPEVCEKDLIRYLVDKKTIVSMAHTSANSKETKEAISAGASQLTHSFNGMKGIHHREPGCIGVSLIDKRVYTEVILDGVHINYDIFKLIYLCKGDKKIILVSDSMRATGLEDGTYELGGQEVFLKNGAARLGSGSLAGSTLTLDKAFRNSVKYGNLTLSEASNLTSKNPAKHLNLERIGEIKEDFFADLVIMNEDLKIKGVISRGIYNT